MLTLLGFTDPPLRFPVRVEIAAGKLWARPFGDRLFRRPRAGAWRNFADTDPEDLQQIVAIANHWGALTRSAADEGENLAVWRDLITDLRTLTRAWTAEGDVADVVEVDGARMVAGPMQARIGEDHQNDGGRFVSLGPLGWGLKTTEMVDWWLLTAIHAVWELAPLRRCRYCGCWFSLSGQRADNSFCSARHRSAFHQKRPPPSAPWAMMIEREGE